MNKVNYILAEEHLVVAFENKDLRIVCENEDLAKESLGTTKLQDRLADMFAASTVRDLLVGNPMETEFKSLSAYKIDIEDGFSMFFSPNHVKTPCLNDGRVDWDKVNRIKIIAILKN